MFQPILAWVQRYERHLSALAMVAGFIVDNIFFKRVDLLETQIVFVSYIAICFTAISLLHWTESRQTASRLRLFLPLAIQFALGGFWSGFVIFYGRSAVLGASWPFLLFLFLVFIGSEYFSKYHARLVFTSVLFFFALYSYAIFAVPVYTGTMGTLTFLGSGVVAICVFALFTMLLRFLSQDRFLSDVWRIRAGAVAVLVIINVSYFAGILPPLPLSAVAGGIYHKVWRVPGNYMANTETQSWQSRYLGLSPVMHVTQDESLFVYSSVFAPTSLATKIVHRWQRYDSQRDKWITTAVVSYRIVGGRDGGYRGYSTAYVYTPGKWRVDIETEDGRLIDRISFKAEQVTTPIATETITLE